MESKKQNSTKQLRNWTLAMGIFLSSSGPILCSNADFSFKAQYTRNKKIWGTYKLKKEDLRITRGSKKWNKKPTQRVGDVIIKDGNIIFVRETKDEGQTKIVVDKIPYAKKGKYTYVNKEPLDKEVMDRLYRPDLKEVTPHLDLLKGTIQYKQLECTRRKRNLTCKINGEMFPAT